MTNEPNDINSREDITRILLSFYKKAFTDELIGKFFTEVVPLDLDTHIPVITDFWETILLDQRKYSKNVMQIHQHISSLSAIKKQHLDRWVKLITETIDEHNNGNRATLMKQRARSIATLMEMKL
ncbi:MAG: group III truncated hemoglobin [Flavisolibacter sp.]|jgi:hemoglobin